MTAPIETVLDEVADVVPDVLRDLLPPERRNGGVCLVATRIGIETLRYFGVRGRPVMTAVLAGNLPWVRWASAGCPGGRDGFPEDAWNVMVGSSDSVEVVEGVDRRGRGGIDGHLAIGVDLDDGRSILVDLDAGQFARPDRGIHVPDVVSVEWHDRTAGSGIDLDGGGVLIYRPHPRPPRYVHAPDWRLSARDAGAAIRRVRSRLETRGDLG